MKIMASGPIISWQIDGETMETVTDFISLGSNITADSVYSHEIKRGLLFGRRVMTNLDSIFREGNGTPLQYFGHLMRRLDSLEKTDARRDWGQEKGTTEDEMVGWHHRLDGHEFE